MNKQMKNMLILAVVGVVIYLVYKRYGSSSEGKAGAYGKMSIFPNVQKAGGTFECFCEDKWGNKTWQRSCRRSQHDDCESCCGHYGKTNVRPSDW